MAIIITRAVAHARQYGEAGLREACAAWLKEGADDLRRRIAHSRFDDGAPPAAGDGKEASH
jgi:hypothetical protein